MPSEPTMGLKPFCVYCGKRFVGRQKQWTLVRKEGSDERHPLHRGCAEKLAALLFRNEVAR
jgi:hypothetical protein